MRKVIDRTGGNSLTVGSGACSEDWLERNFVPFHSDGFIC